MPELSDTELRKEAQMTQMYLMAQAAFDKCPERSLWCWQLCVQHSKLCQPCDSQTLDDVHWRYCNAKISLNPFKCVYFTSVEKQVL